MRYDINPLILTYLVFGEYIKAYRLSQANIAPEGNIANPAMDLYRCVFSVKDNSRTLAALFAQKRDTGMGVLTFKRNIYNNVLRRV